MSTFVATTVTAEVRRLRATRSTTYALLAVLAFAALLAVGGVLTAGHQENAPLSAHTLDDAIRAPAKVLGFVMLLLGVLAAAGEYRHHTVVPTLLAEPRRPRVVAAKVVAVAGLGVAAALATAALFAAVCVPLLAARDAPAQHLAHVPLGVLALVVSAAGYGVIGVALGLLLRNQTTALVTALLWQFVVEGVLPVVLRAPSLPTYLPGGAVTSLTHLGQHTAAGDPTPWLGGVLFLGYAGALLGAALAVTVPRDVT
jgi:ABC-2 type transport system permease protein